MEGENKQVSRSIKCALIYLQEFKAAQENLSQSKEANTYGKWKAPAEPSYKLNGDVAFNSNLNSYCLGAIIRDQ